VVILDKLPADANQLDNKEIIPTFNYGNKKYIGENLSFEELKKLHEEARKSYERISKPRKKITIKQALSLVNCEKRSRPDDFEKRLSDKELLKCKFAVPLNWVELLKKSNGGYLNSDCLLIPLNGVEEFTTEKQREGKGFYEEYPENRISVAKMADGDWYDLVIEGDCNIDCHVAQVTYEGGSILREWDSIATFIYDMILANE